MIQRVTAVSANRVKSFSLFRNLPKRVLEYILGQTHVEHHNAGSEITHPGESDGEVHFLLEGEVKISQGSGKQTLRSGDDEANSAPLNAVSLGEDTIVATTAIDTLCLPRELFDAIRNLPPVVHKRSSQPIELMDSSGPEATLYWEFHEAIREDKLELPSMPDIALRIAKVVHDRNSDSQAIARVVQADPTIAARIISVVNSAAYRGKQTIDNLPDAVTRLGRSVTHNLVISFALGKLFHSRSDTLQSRMTKLWQHVSYVAPICHELARVTPGLEPDQAILCGLLHDIGALAILGAARSKPVLAENPELLDQVIENLKAEVGAMVLRKWEFPDYFVQTALHAEDWMEDISHEPDYVDLVVVAQLHAYVGTPMMSSLPRLDLVPAFHKLALGKLTPRHSLGVLENAKERIRELKEMLALPGA
ncbi:MAG: HDOD domain-containing protein [Candidatus Thiodiazotropha sp. (ex Myrtea sp. 'scaly one' KF741663)]|nr:HDOD domain-containing protein [Candidatus Thiodiazotropha sp. (ex Myrtea sp. 'scaly one' KF741663)]